MVNVICQNLSGKLVSKWRVFTRGNLHWIMISLNKI